MHYKHLAPKINYLPASCAYGDMHDKFEISTLINLLLLSEPNSRFILYFMNSEYLVLDHSKELGSKTY
jgi:hypothetical protein